MFGSNAPFGSNTGGFGQQNTTPAFGTPAPAAFGGGFGAPAPAAPFGSPASAPGGFGGGFGAPAPASGFGGGAFGTPAPAPSGFGSTGGGFGTSNASPFGAPAPAPTGGLFGAPAPAPTGGLFGAPAPAPGGFGTSTGGGFGGFGSSPSPAPSAFGGGSAFGAPAPAPSTGLFGAPAPSTGGFGGGGGFGAPTTTTSAFGAPAPSTGGMFGAPAPAPSGGMFGAPAVGGGGGGTKMAPFAPSTRQDGSTAINMQSISAMSQYEQKSFEELRFEDYSQGNRGTGNASGGTSGGFGGFGSPAPAPSGGLFGAPSPAPGGFGAPAPSPGGFGGFGSPAPAPVGFGGSTFGAPAPGGFGAPAPAPFGSPAPAPGGFGSGGFGAPAPSTGLFGAPAPAPSGGLFGAPAPSSGGLFGAPSPAPGGFGAPAPSSGGLFGSPAPAPSGGLFGAPAPAPGGFGAPAPAPFGAPAPGGFGFGSPSPAPSGGLFGAPSPAPFGAPAPSGGLFGTPAPAPGGSLFGAPAPGGFGSAPAPGGSMFGAPSPAPGGFYGMQAPAMQQMPAAPAVGSVMPPAADEILTAQLTALENKRKEMEKSDNFRGKPSESASIQGITLSEQEGLAALTPVRASYPAYRAAPRSNAKIRPRGFASPEKTATPSLSRLGTGGRPMATPDSLAASSVTRLVINPSPKPKMRLTLEESTKETLRVETNQSPSMEHLSFNKASEQTPEAPAAARHEGTPVANGNGQSNGGDPAHEYYKQAIASPDEAAGTATPTKKNSAPVLTKKGYTCTPSIQELQSMLPEDLAAVSSFSVERPGFGKIEWEGAVDVRGINIDNVVQIGASPPSASVYAQEEKEGSKPPVGTKLNRPAIITLENIFPPEGTSSEKFSRKVEKSTARNHAQLIDYDASAGEWKFRVLHFSRYAWTDEDSDSEESMEQDQDFESGERGGRSLATKGILKERKHQLNVAFAISSEEDEERDESKVFKDAEMALESVQRALNDKVASGILKKKLADFSEEIERNDEMDDRNQYVPKEEDFQEALSRGGVCSMIAEKSKAKSSSVDFGLRMRGSFRVGWAPDGSFLCLKRGGILSRRKPVFSQGSKEDLHLLENHRENSCKIDVAENSSPQFTLPMASSSKSLLRRALKSYANPNDRRGQKRGPFVGSQAFSLLKCLLDSREEDDDKPLGAEADKSDTNVIEVRRIHALTQWLVKSCAQEADEEIKESISENDTCAALLAAVTSGDIQKACSVAEDLGYFQLSTMLASQPDAKQDARRQIMIWTDIGATTKMPEALLRIYFLIAGDPKMEEDIYRKKYSPFDWRRRLAMRLVYESTPTHENLSFLMQEYESKFRSGVAPYPQPSYMKNSRDEIQCVLYRLLRFGKNDFEISLREVVDPLGHTSLVHDFSLSFHLAAAISAMGCPSPLSAIEEQNLIDGYAAQLLTDGKWEWAVYVSLCDLCASESHTWRSKKAKSIIVQNYREDSSDAKKHRQFLEDAGVPPSWFEEAAALQCAASGDSYGFLSHMVQVSTDETCATLEKVLIPNMLFMSKENLAESLKLLEVFAVDETSLACAVYDFFQLYGSIMSLEGAPQADIDGAMPALLESCESIEHVFATYKGEQERVQGPDLCFPPTVVPISSFLAEGLSQISLFKLQLKALQSGISISSTASQILNLSEPLRHEVKEAGLAARENICRWLM